MGEPAKSDQAYLWDMLEAARLVVRYVDGMSLEDYLIDDKTQAAVERRIEIIGEAARRVSSDFESAHPEVPWQKIVAQRHVLAHEYGEIIGERIWLVATNRIPELVRMLEPLVDRAP